MAVATTVHPEPRSTDLDGLDKAIESHPIWTELRGPLLTPVEADMTDGRSSGSWPLDTGILHGALSGATITVARDTKLWRDRASRYRVQIDGATHGSLRQGQTVNVAVGPGAHTVQVRLELISRSPRVTVQLAPDQHVILRCRPRAPWRGIVRPNTYIDLRPETSNSVAGQPYD